MIDYDDNTVAFSQKFLEDLQVYIVVATELGMCKIDMRLPLCEMEDATKARLIGALKKHGLL